MTRRALLLAAIAAPGLRADAADDAWELLASAARALCEATAVDPPNRGTAAPFLGYFDRKMPGYETLRNNVTALIAGADLQATIDPLKNEGDDHARDLELDWTMRITTLVDGVTSSQRRETVKCRVEKQGRNWRIVSIAPLAFFAP
ncbi:MAG TPA: hypothetical protein VGH38_27110 [Bryobacteraceae bacterium]|jgi:hypothetical protein